MERPLIIILNTDRFFLELMGELLRDEGYDTLIQTESQEAFEVILRRQPHLVIIELLITDPERGWMVLNKMRLHPQTAKIPVVIASTATQLIRDNEQHLREKGCNILLKPFDLEELLTMVSKMIPPPAA
jgi:CheY-like chemotaxis protein